MCPQSNPEHLVLIPLCRLYDWRRGAQICGFNNGNPKGTSVTSLHFVDEEVGGALVVGSSDGVVRIYNNYDPCYSDGNPVQLVSGFRALLTMVPATYGAGIVTEWNPLWNRLLCGGDSESIYDWDATTERCVTVSTCCTFFFPKKSRAVHTHNCRLGHCNGRELSPHFHDIESVQQTNLCSRFWEWGNQDI